MRLNRMKATTPCPESAGPRRPGRGVCCERCEVQNSRKAGEGWRECESSKSGFFLEEVVGVREIEGVFAARRTAEPEEAFERLRVALALSFQTAQPPASEGCEQPQAAAREQRKTDRC